MRRYFTIKGFQRSFIPYVSQDAERIFVSMPHRGEYDDIAQVARPMIATIWDSRFTDVTGISDPNLNLTGVAWVNAGTMDPATGFVGTSYLDALFYLGIFNGFQSTAPLWRLSLIPPVTSGGNFD